jgi:hypothetical protein
VDKSYELGILYSNICDGFTGVLLKNKNKIFFKHPTVAEHFKNYSNYEFFLKEGSKKGLVSEKEKIEEAISNSWWSLEYESKIDLLIKTINNLKITKDKLLYPSQKKSIDEQIEKNNSILISYNKQRRELIGFCLEEYANNKLTEELLIEYTFEDSKFTNKYFKDKNDYYDLTDNDAEEIRNAYFNYTDIFNSQSLKKVGASGFFQNLMFLSEDALNFWGIAASKCTKYQIDLLMYGKMFKNFIKMQSETGKQISDDILNDSDKLVEWFDNYNSSPSKGNKFIKKSNKTNTKNAVGSYVGASQQDLKEMGVKVEKIKGKSLLEMAKESGGIIEKSDYLNVRENN